MLREIYSPTNIETERHTERKWCAIVGATFVIVGSHFLPAYNQIFGQFLEHIAIKQQKKG